MYPLSSIDRQTVINCKNTPLRSPIDPEMVDQEKTPGMTVIVKEESNEHSETTSDYQETES